MTFKLKILLYFGLCSDRYFIDYCHVMKIMNYETK